MASYFQSPSWVGSLISTVGQYRSADNVARYNKSIAEADRASKESIAANQIDSNESIAKANRETQKEVAEINAKAARDVAGINAISNVTRTFIPILWGNDGDNNSSTLGGGKMGATEGSVSEADRVFDEAFPTLKDSTSISSNAIQTLTDTFDKVNSKQLRQTLIPSLSGALTALGSMGVAGTAGLVLSVL